MEWRSIFGNAAVELRSKRVKLGKRIIISGQMRPVGADLQKAGPRMNIVL